MTFDQNVSTYEELHAEELGRKAQRAGAPLSDCPYGYGSFKSEALRVFWQKGYTQSETVAWTELLSIEPFG